MLLPAPLQWDYLGSFAFFRRKVSGPTCKPGKTSWVEGRKLRIPTLPSGVYNAPGEFRVNFESFFNLSEVCSGMFSREFVSGAVRSSGISDYRNESMVGSLRLDRRSLYLTATPHLMMAMGRREQEARTRTRMIPMVNRRTPFND